MAFKQLWILDLLFCANAFFILAFEYSKFRKRSFVLERLILQWLGIILEKWQYANDATTIFNAASGGILSHDYNCFHSFGAA